MNKDVKIGLGLGVVILLVVGVHLGFNRGGNGASDDTPPTPPPNRAALTPSPIVDTPTRPSTLDPAFTSADRPRIDPDALASARVEPGLPEMAGRRADRTGPTTSEDIVRNVIESANGSLAAAGNGESRQAPPPAGSSPSRWPSFDEIVVDPAQTRPDPPPTRNTLPPPTPPAAGGLGLRTHTVAQGDVLSRISQQYYGSQNHWREILEANRDLLKSERDLRPGMVLIVPRIDAAPAPAPTVIDRFGRSLPAGDTYTVERGDTFWSIAAKLMGSGVRHEALYEANRDRLGLKRPADLKPGMELVIPRQ